MRYDMMTHSKQRWLRLKVGRAVSIFCCCCWYFASLVSSCYKKIQTSLLSLNDAGLSPLRLACVHEVWWQLLSGLASKKAISSLEPSDTDTVAPRWQLHLIAHSKQRQLGSKVGWVDFGHEYNPMKVINRIARKQFHLSSLQIQIQLLLLSGWQFHLIA